MSRFVVVLVVIFCWQQSVFSQVIIKEKFNATHIPPAPDFSQAVYWAALPDRKDAADNIPKNKINLTENQAQAKADVFFLHPTIFTEEPLNAYKWNADANDKAMNQKVDNSTILNQASVFNASCRIFAPRYRQAHLYSFYTSDTSSARQAFDVAYTDIKAAFEYYLSHYNNGRPIVIAAHSQGTYHAKRLLKEFFDGKNLQNQLVAAYLVGIVTPPNEFKNIPAGICAGQIGCFVTWRTFRSGYIPDDHFKLHYDKCLSVNPVTWDTTTALIDRKYHKGGVGYKFTLTKPCVTTTQNYKGMLWIGRLHIPGGFLIRTKNWHVGDYNLFWLNIRENVALRISNFLKEGKATGEK
jgi:hypothetical protein